MPVLINRPFMDVRASKGIVQRYYPNQQGEGVTPPNNYRVMEEMWKKDEIIATAFDTTVDMTTRNGYDFISKTGDKKLSKTERNRAFKKFEELNFSEVIDNILYQMIAYGDSFLELRRTEGTVVDELHPLETTEMQIDYDKHGKVLGYIQKPSHAPLTKILFAKEDVIHFRMKWMGSRVYSESPLEPIGRVWAAKHNSFNYLDQIFMNLHPELFIHLKGASKDQYMAAREVIWRAKTQPGRPIITYGAADSSTDVKEVTANFGNEQGLFRVLEYLQEAVLMITRVPPVWIGLVNQDGANKGNSEAQIFSFETRIKKIHQKTQDKANRELMSALGFSHIAFNWNPITSKDEKETFQNAAVIQSMNVKPEAIVKYLKRNGVTDIATEDFRTPEEMMALQQEGQEGEGNQTARNLTSDSRKPSGKGVLEKSNLNRSGISEAGSKKLDEQKIKMRSMKGYPYKYEVQK